MQLVNAHGLADDAADGHAGVEAAHGILKDDLHLAAEFAHAVAVGAQDVFTLVVDAAGGGGDEAQDAAANGGFAAARLADQAQGFAGENVEADVVDGADVADVGAQEAALDRKPGFEVFDGEKWW